MGTPTWDRHFSAPNLGQALLGSQLGTGTFRFERASSSILMNAAKSLPSSALPPLPSEADTVQLRDAALARIPHADFLLTARLGEARDGLIVRRVQICGTNPAMVLIAMEKGHALSPLIRDSRTFGLALLGAQGRLLARLFGSQRTLGDDPFLALPMKEGVLGAPIVTRAEAWYDCEVVRHFDVESNYEMYVGLVRSAGCAELDATHPSARVGSARAEVPLRKSETARLPHVAHLPKVAVKSRRSARA